MEQLLARGDEVVVFARGAYPDLVARGARVYRGDLQDPEAVIRACEGVQTLFHVAANHEMWGPWDMFYQANVVGTRNVIDACRHHAIPRLIYTSSPSVVFANGSQEGCDESLPYPEHYESFYAKSKAEGEKLAIAANGNGLCTCSLRPHLIFGPDDPYLLPTLVARGMKKSIPQVGDGLNKMDFCYVEDAARAHLQAADALTSESAVAGSVYFITQGEPVPFYPWLNALFTELGVPPIRRKISLRTARSAAAVLESIHRLLPFLGAPRITRFLATELAMSHYFDISRARADFGYRPQYTMAQALQKTIPYLRQQMQAGDMQTVL